MFGFLPAARFADQSDSRIRTGCALLLHCDGSAGSVSTLTDSSGNGRNATCTSVTLVTPGLVGSASANFNGSSSYANVADDAGLEFGSGDFEIEMTVKPTSLPSSGSYAGLITKRTTGTSDRAWNIVLSGSTGVWFEASTTGTNGNLSLQPAFTLPINRKSHIKVFRRGPMLALAINGVVRAAINIGTSAIYNAASAISLGRLSTGYTSNLFNGQIDEVCITVGSSRHRWNFVPPNDAYTV